MNREARASWRWRREDSRAERETNPKLKSVAIGHSNDHPGQPPVSSCIRLLPPTRVLLQI